MIHWAYTNLSSMTDDQYQTLYNQSSPQRQARAQQYLRQEDKRRCVVADALLRYVLCRSGHSHRPNIVCSPYGKPLLADHPEFHFNLSHSGNYVAIAWGDTPVGIDVERLQSSLSLQTIAQKHFTPQEQAYISQDLRKFFHIWTRKEAYIKYLGTGLRTKLTDFSVIGNLPAHFETLDFADACLSLCSQTPPQTIMQLQLSDLLQSQ